MNVVNLQGMSILFVIFAIILLNIQSCEHNRAVKLINDRIDYLERGEKTLADAITNIVWWANTNQSIVVK